MSCYSHRLLALALLLTFAVSAQAAESQPSPLGWTSRAQINALPVAERPPLDPTCPGTWITPIAASTQVADPTLSNLEVEAEDVHYDFSGTSTLKGNVSIRQPGRRIDADNAELTQNQNQGRFTGNILIAEPGLLLTGDQAEFDFASQRSSIKRTEFVSSSIHAHGRADQIIRNEQGLISIAHGEYSTCAPNDRAWHFVASKIRLNQASGRGEVSNAVLHIKDVPVMYLPYFNFPIDARRQSGMLTPRFGSTNDGGLDLAVPIYLNIAPNFDATVTPRLMTRRGTMVEAELRYLLPSLGEGSLAGGYLGTDPLFADLDRKSLAWRHHGNLTPALQLNTNVNYISDNAYFIDLGTDLSLTNTTFQERTGELIYSRDAWTLTSRVQGFQTIDPLIVDHDKPYARLPQLLLTGGLPTSRGWQPSLGTELTYFERAINDNSGPEINGARYRLDPALSYVVSSGWGHITPSVKLRTLNYELTGAGIATDSESRNQTVPSLSLDTGLIFEREQGKLLQTLEPRAFYLYAPYQNQDDLPNFDTANTTFSYQQLFRDSRFSGGDRLDDANQVSLGLTSRFIANDSGEELVRASAGQIFYLRDRKVRLDPNAAIATDNSSGLAAQLSARIGPRWNGSANALWTPRLEHSSQYGIAVNYLPESHDRLANLGYNFRREDPSIGQKALRQVSSSLVLPVGINWQLLALWQYDLRGRETQDSLIGMQYEACCWKVRLFERQFLADPDNISQGAQRQRRAFFIEVELKGLAGISSGVKNLLSKNMFGYDQLINNTSSSPEPR